jgi:hypothetical protein
MLNRLEFPDRPPELLALVRKDERVFEAALHRPDHLLGAQERTEDQQTVGAKRRRRTDERLGHLGPGEDDRRPRLESDVAALADFPARPGQESEVSHPVSVAGENQDVVGVPAPRNAVGPALEPVSAGRPRQLRRSFLTRRR